MTTNNSWLYLDFEHRQTSAFSTVKTFAVFQLCSTHLKAFSNPLGSLFYLLFQKLLIVQPLREFLKNPQSKPSFSPRNFDPQPQKHCPHSHLEFWGFLRVRKNFFWNFYASLTSNILEIFRNFQIFKNPQTLRMKIRILVSNRIKLTKLSGLVRFLH